MQIANCEHEGMIGMCAELCGYVSSSVTELVMLHMHAMQLNLFRRLWCDILIFVVVVIWISWTWPS